MTSTTMHLEELESRTLSALVVVSKVKRAAHDAHLHLRSYYWARNLAALLRYGLAEIQRGNAAGILDKMTEEQFAAFVFDLARLRDKLRAVLEELRGERLDRWPHYRSVLRKLDKQADRLNDLIETFELGANPKFRALVDEAVSRIK